MIRIWKHNKTTITRKNGMKKVLVRLRVERERLGLGVKASGGGRMIDSRGSERRGRGERGERPADDRRSANRTSCIHCEECLLLLLLLILLLLLQLLRVGSSENRSREVGQWEVLREDSLLLLLLLLLRWGRGARSCSEEISEREFAAGRSRSLSSHAEVLPLLSVLEHGDNNMSAYIVRMIKLCDSGMGIQITRKMQVRRVDELSVYSTRKRTDTLWSNGNWALKPGASWGW